nr:immunoglobulin light chain junction region [Macaca mulatta]
GSSYVDSNVLF